MTFFQTNFMGLSSILRPRQSMITLLQVLLTGEAVILDFLVKIEI